MSDILKQIGYLAGASRFRRISEKLQQDGDKIYSHFDISFKASWFSVYYVLAKTQLHRHSLHGSIYYKLYSNAIAIRIPS